MKLQYSFATRIVVREVVALLVTLEDKRPANGRASCRNASLTEFRRILTNLPISVKIEILSSSPDRCFGQRLSGFVFYLT
jgi:hypothetical protein